MLGPSMSQPQNSATSASRGEMSQRASGARSEVEHALPLPRPAIRKHGDDLALRLTAQPEVGDIGVAPPLDRETRGWRDPAVAWVGLDPQSSRQNRACHSVLSAD